MTAQTPLTTRDSLDASIKSAWQQTADVAERYKVAENATRPFAKIMIDVSDQLSPLSSAPVRILDLACGTGAVEAELYAAQPREKWDDLDVLAGDISAPMLEYLSKRKDTEGWSGVRTRIIDGAKLDSVGGEIGRDYARVFVGFAIFVLPVDTLGKLAQLVQPGGTLAITSWAHLPWFSLLEETYAGIENGPDMPTHEQLYAGMMNGQPWQDRAFVEKQLEGAGLQGVKVVQEAFNVDCGTPDNFMTAMGFVLGLLSQRWPEEKRERWLKEISAGMKRVAVEKVGGEDKHLFLEFEGIVGVGVKGE
ncbi:coq5 family [Stagonosporopsis vannaccii]|nr:coq5 family [Stagonosporopsis vannaccii]